MIRKRVLSGVQPTGGIHIGNWLGAIRNWVNLQEDNDTFVCVVDLHAITVPHEPKSLAENTISTAALYIACGMDPHKSSIFVQSQIPAHSELCWILNCLTPLNWMERMIQFKEKALKQGDNVSIGLLDYPVLMAADILLYDADLVPVGEDQKQHLELARNIAQQRINSRFGKENNPILKVPKPLVIKEGSKIMSLTDARKKMSKSDPNEASRIELLDPPNLITKKVKRAKTDSQLGLEFGNVNRPEADNLLSIYSILKEISPKQAFEECSDMGWGTFKPLLAEMMISAIEPIQNRYYELMKDPRELSSILSRGKDQANNVAMQTLKRVKDALGFLN
tara:strand:- start:30055 stop:31062 length:1008 start_codon:yes stop_codon:yes gene_type:complete